MTMPVSGIAAAMSRMRAMGMAAMRRMAVHMPGRRPVVMVVMMVRTHSVGRIDRIATADTNGVAAVSPIATIAAISAEVVVTAVMGAAREQQRGSDNKE